MYLFFDRQQTNTSDKIPFSSLNLVFKNSFGVENGKKKKDTKIDNKEFVRLETDGYKIGKLKRILDWSLLTFKLF